MLLFALVLVGWGPVGAQFGSRDAAIASCIELFGPRVDLSLLFEVNKFYVLRVEVARDGQIDVAAVEPRFYYRDTHPEWDQPDNFEWLNSEMVAEMLGKLQKLRPLGKLVKPHVGLVLVTNLTGPITNEYEHAAVTLGKVVDVRRPEDAPVLYRYIRVRYKSAGDPTPNRRLLPTASAVSSR